MSATRNALFYLDQNIVGYLRDGKMGSASVTGVDWVYSDVHFSEIARGNDATSFLQVLRELKARQIRIVLDDQYRATDKACVNEHSCPFERYERYLEAVSEVQFDDSLFTDFIGRLFGADNFENVRALPAKLRNQVETLLNPIGAEAAIDLRTASLRAASKLEELIESELKEPRSLEQLRKPLGADNGRIGNINSHNPILQIWELIRERCPGMSVGQFFGSPTFDGIVGCHTALNFIGYRTDKGIADPKNIPNILSDGRHIAYAAFCEALISADRRVCEKAKAIYRYLNVSTEVMRLEFEAPDSGVS